MAQSLHTPAPDPMPRDASAVRYAMQLVEYRLLLEAPGSRRHQALAQRLAGLSDRLARDAGPVVVQPRPGR